MSVSRTILALALTMAACASASADEVVVKMLNNGADGSQMVFDPAIVKIKPGDSVKFEATDQGHNVETIKGMAPEGAAPVKSPFGKDETVKFDKEGVYGFKCMPHYSMGMVALVVVGTKLDNLDKAKSTSVSPGARKRLEPLFAQVQ